MSTNHRGITVFVRRVGGTFHASTNVADGFAESATLAAAKAAANHYGVEPAEIELTPNGDHVLIATVRHPERRHRGLLIAAAMLLAATAVLAALVGLGGAR